MNKVMKQLKRINIISLIAVILFLIACNKTSNKISNYIKNNCNFENTAVFFNDFDSSYYTSPADYIDLKKALKVDYDTLYLISAGFKTDISDIIGFQYKGRDFTFESEDYNLLLLVKQNHVVYEETFKKLLDKVNFEYSHVSTVSSSFCLLKHSSSIYKVKSEKNGFTYRYYLFNVDSSEIVNIP